MVEKYYVGSFLYAKKKKKKKKIQCTVYLNIFSLKG